MASKQDLSSEVVEYVVSDLKKRGLLDVVCTLLSNQAFSKRFIKRVLDDVRLSSPVKKIIIMFMEDSPPSKRAEHLLKIMCSDAFSQWEVLIQFLNVVTQAVANDEGVAEEFDWRSFGEDLLREHLWNMVFKPCEGLTACSTADDELKGEVSKVLVVLECDHKQRMHIQPMLEKSRDACSGLVEDMSEHEICFKYTMLESSKNALIERVSKAEDNIVLKLCVKQVVIDQEIILDAADNEAVEDDDDSTTEPHQLHERLKKVLEENHAYTTEIEKLKEDLKKSDDHVARLKQTLLEDENVESSNSEEFAKLLEESNTLKNKLKECQRLLEESELVKVELMGRYRTMKQISDAKTREIEILREGDRERISLKHKLQKNEQERRHLSDALAVKESMIEVLQKDNSEIISLMERKEQECQHLYDALAAKEREIEMLRKDNSDKISLMEGKEQECQHLSDALAAKEREIEMLQKDNSDIISLMERKEQECQRLSDALAAKEREIEMLRKDNSDKISLMERKEQECQHLSDALAANEREIEMLRKDNSDKISVIERKEQECQRLFEALAAKEREIEILQKGDSEQNVFKCELERKEQEYQCLSNKLAAKESELAALQKGNRENINLKHRLETKAQEYQCLSEELKAKESELEVLRKGNKERIILKCKLERKEQEYQCLSDELKEKESELEVLRKGDRERIRLKCELERKEHEYQCLRNALAAKESEIEMLRKDKIENVNLKCELERKEQERQHLFDALTAKEREIEMLRKDNNENISLKCELEKKEQECQHLYDVLAAKEREIEMLRKDNSDKISLKRQLEGKEQECQRLSHALAAKESEIEILQKELAAKKLKIQKECIAHSETQIGEKQGVTHSPCMQSYCAIEKENVMELLCKNPYCHPPLVWHFPLKPAMSPYNLYEVCRMLERKEWRQCSEVRHCNMVMLAHPLACCKRIMLFFCPENLTSLEVYCFCSVEEMETKCTSCKEAIHTISLHLGEALLEVFSCITRPVLAFPCCCCDPCNIQIVNHDVRTTVCQNRKARGIVSEMHMAWINPIMQSDCLQVYKKPDGCSIKGFDLVSSHSTDGPATVSSTSSSGTAPTILSPATVPSTCTSSSVTAPTTCNLAINDLQEVMGHFQYFTEWMTLGGNLGLSSGFLGEIRDNKSNAEDSLRRVLEQWLKLNYDTYELKPPTWSNLAKALDNIDRALSIKIIQKHLL